MNTLDDLRPAGTPPGPGLAPLPLMIALLVTAIITLDPRLLADAQGHADHMAACLLFWAMSAGYVRGVGFVPRHALPRWLLSAPACLGALAAAVLRLISG